MPSSVLLLNVMPMLMVSDLCVCVIVSLAVNMDIV